MTDAKLLVALSDYCLFWLKKGIQLLIDRGHAAQAIRFCLIIIE